LLSYTGARRTLNPPLFTSVPKRYEKCDTELKEKYSIHFPFLSVLSQILLDLKFE